SIFGFRIFHKKIGGGPVSGPPPVDLSRLLVSRILFPLSRRRPFLWGARRRASQATYPRIIAPGAWAVRLFGLAAGGVCLAAAVTRGAVRSYRTISPLPARPRAFARGAPLAVYFLLHFPSAWAAMNRRLYRL